MHTKHDKHAKCKLKREFGTSRNVSEKHLHYLCGAVHLSPEHLKLSFAHYPNFQGFIQVVLKSFIITI